jgi:uncharacterized protein (TIGR02118 family)
MIRMSVLYPKGEGKTFDLDYYTATHMPLAERTMGPDRVEVDKGLDGPYEAVGHLYYASMEALQAGMVNNAEAMADIPNFTNIEPVAQISEVVT